MIKSLEIDNTGGIVKPLIWKKEYELGIEAIDEQHKGLVAIINDVQTGWQEGLPPEALNNVIDRLVDYTKEHFQFEEKLMSEHGYPDLENHKTSHDGFISMINHFRNATPESLYDFLKIWLTSHIMASDRAYVPYIVKAKSK